MVKFHTGNILGKLGVKNRTQAVAKTRELGILKADPDFHSKTNWLILREILTKNILSSKLSQSVFPDPLP